MLNIDFESLKRKSSELMEKSAKVIGKTVVEARKVGTKAAKVALDATAELADKANETVNLSDLGKETKSVISSILTTTKSTSQKVKENLDKPKIFMEHKIIMLGGRRAGKSTILASILDQFRRTPGDICVVMDRTDYTQQIETKDGPQPLPTLDIKINEIKSYLNKHKVLNKDFLVDMSPTYGKGSYTLEVSSKNTAVNFEFVDVPGEWMEATKKGYATLIELIKQSDVFVVAIDTPFLMNADNDETATINNVYNRIHEISNALTNIQIQTSDDLKKYDKDLNIVVDLKRIILCPVKCEKWVRNGKADEVVKKVLTAYRDLINRWLNCPEVSIEIMPIQTVGGFESSRLLPALLYYKNESEDYGVSCSEDPISKLLFDKDGKIIKRKPGDNLEEDQEKEIDHAIIPLSWYRTNGAGYSPKFCEQPAYHILKFLVEKEDHINEVRAQLQRQRPSYIPEWLWKIIMKFFELFNPTFGVYLPVWRDVISKLNRQQLIKTHDDGFKQITENIK